MLDLPPLIDRRECMKLMGAALALAGGCARSPVGKIVPYASQPVGLVPDEPLYFATALTRGGYAHGVLIESHMGRPTKVEGNPGHPASLGSTGPIEQARILELWDPERSRAPLHDGEISGWEEFETRVLESQPGWRAAGGAGLRILGGAASSPTLLGQFERLLGLYPEARLHRYEPLNRDNVYAGTQAAFGRALEPVYHFDRAAVVVSFEADFLGAMPGQVRYARDFASTRRPESGSMSRLYVAECMPSLSGAAADHRLPWRSGEMLALMRRLAASLSGASAAGATSADGLSPAAAAWLSSVGADLQAHRGRSLILAGDAQPTAVQLLAHQLNALLGNLGHTVELIAPPTGFAEADGESLAQLVQDMHAQRVQTLVILGTNPVYDAPADLEFARALAAVPLSIHHGLYADETARRCRWHLPAAHELESWSDARAFDGTITLQQPLIAPLYAGRSAHELLALLGGEAGASAHELVRATWWRRFGADAERQWQESLRSGTVAASASPAERVQLTAASAAAAIATAAAADGAAAVSTSAVGSADPQLELLLSPDPMLWDGRYASLAWLQELPRPLTQLTWDNAAMMSAELAAQLGVGNEEVVELSLDGRTLAAPVWIVPQHAPRAVTLYLGSGRTHAGAVGSSRGVSGYALRRAASPWFSRGLRIRKTGARVALATVQYHHRMEGRDVVRSAALASFLEHPDFAAPPAELGTPSLYPPHRYDGYAWGMSVDLTACIGCAACTIACQAENNIPTVGKEQVLHHREMHWIRVDRYDEPGPGAPHTLFQPVPCMQCEHAPCEVVCPVEASVHDAEGINVQVYNRCVGTRFCSNNCPYKVRRFNFLQYSQDDPGLDAQRNPEVTVRMRGVMEKCNYCLQRIVRARITADREDRRLRDGEVVTACQAVCPTQAIVFGDLNDPQSAVRTVKASPRRYVLLEELNTRPRTTYLAKIVNPRLEPRGTGGAE